MREFSGEPLPDDIRPETYIALNATNGSAKPSVRPDRSGTDRGINSMVETPGVEDDPEVADGTARDHGFEPLSGRSRPEPPGGGAARWFRALAGVREDVLRWVPEERPRYTRLGMIVLNTGLLAGMSFLIALRSVVTVPLLAVLPIAAFWAYFVVTFDGWLIASTHGVIGAARLRYFLPRLVISLLLGVAIAEPLVLWILRPAIHKEVQDSRQAEILAYESKLKKCNPDTGGTPPDSACVDFRVSVADEPSVKRAQRDSQQQLRATLAKQVAAIENKIDELESLARDECSGKKGQGLSGAVGEGPNCLRNRAQVDRYREDNQLVKRQLQLDSLDTQIADLNVQVDTASKAYGSAVQTKITELVDEKRRSQGQTIGILDEVDALGRLASQSMFVNGVQWILRILLVVIDTMPVLAKLLGGTTKYDRLLSLQTEMGAGMHAGAVEDSRREFSITRQAKKERQEQEAQLERSRVQARQRAEIDQLVAQFSRAREG